MNFVSAAAAVATFADAMLRLLIVIKRNLLFWQMRAASLRKKKESHSQLAMMLLHCAIIIYQHNKVNIFSEISVG